MEAYDYGQRTNGPSWTADGNVFYECNHMIDANGVDRVILLTDKQRIYSDLIAMPEEASLNAEVERCIAPSSIVRQPRYELQTRAV